MNFTDIAKRIKIIPGAIPPTPPPKALNMFFNFMPAILPQPIPARTNNKPTRGNEISEIKETKEMKQESDTEIKSMDDEERESNFFWDITYPEPEVSLSDEDILPEEYQPYEETIPGSFYFTNTENILDLPGVFSMYAQGTLVDSIKSWLSQQGISGAELRCIDDSVVSNETTVTFRVECTESNQVIICTYTEDSHSWNFKAQ